jgi:DDE superfamily endonuclease
MDDRSAPDWPQAHPAPRLEPPRPTPGSGGAAPLPVCYLYAFVHPSSGRTWWLLLPTVSVAAFTLALTEFAQAVGAGPGKQVPVVLDGAGWHVSAYVHVPAGVHVHCLPPYSPELQPAERLWPLTNEALANRHFHDLEALQDAQAQRCLTLQTQPEVIRAHTSFHWWPQTA